MVPIKRNYTGILAIRNQTHVFIFMKIRAESLISMMISLISSNLYQLKLAMYTRCVRLLIKFSLVYSLKIKSVLSKKMIV